MINIGEYIEMAVEWLTEHGASFFDLLSLGVESVIDGILCVLLGIPFYITIAILTFLALYKSGRGTGIFTLLGLSLVYGMGILGGDHADPGPGTLLHRHGADAGNPPGDLDGGQRTLQQDLAAGA